jgi:hypothetical protein
MGTAPGARENYTEDVEILVVSEAKPRIFRAAGHSLHDLLHERQQHQ